jgi:hypothetical protein
LRGRNFLEGKSVQIDHVDAVARVDAFDASVNYKFLCELLQHTLMMRELGRVFTSNFHLLPRNSLDNSAFSGFLLMLSRGLVSLVVKEVNVDLPHVSEAAFLQVLSTVNIEPILKFDR